MTHDSSFDSPSLTTRAHHAIVEGELGRRLIHMAGTAFPALYILPWVDWWHVALLLVLATTIAIGLETLRLLGGLELFIYEHFTREYEQDSPAAYVMYMISMTVVAVIFDPMIAIPAILMLTLADPVAGLVSGGDLRLVKRPLPMAVMFLACAVLALPFTYETPLAVVLGAAGGMIADGIKPQIRGFVVDDDLTIAPFAAVGLWIGNELGSFSLQVGPTVA